MSWNARRIASHNQNSHENSFGFLFPPLPGPRGFRHDRNEGGNANLLTGFRGNSTPHDYDVGGNPGLRQHPTSLDTIRHRRTPRGGDCFLVFVCSKTTGLISRLWRQKWTGVHCTPRVLTEPFNIISSRTVRRGSWAVRPSGIFQHHQSS